MKALDIVKPTSGEPFVGFITEMSDERASVTWFDNPSANRAGLKNAWWISQDLIVIDNLAAVIAGEMAHPFGGAKAANRNLYLNEI